MSVVAPLWRRLFAGVLDVVFALGGIGGLGAIGWHLCRRFPTVRRWVRAACDHMPDAALTRPGAKRNLPARWPRALWLASVAAAVVSRNWRGPGGRIMQLRRVDARTAGRVTVRSALINFAAAYGWKRVNARLYAPVKRRGELRLSELQPALAEVQRMYRDDPEARQRAIADLYRAHNVNPLSSCLWQLPGMAMPVLPALWSRRRQAAFEWLAGTVVVRQK